LGSYRDDLYPSRLKKLFLEKIGVGTKFGGSMVTDGIYLFDPNLYKNKFFCIKGKVIHIEKSLTQFIEDNNELLNSTKIAIKKTTKLL
jgi:hypothetical protein